MRDSGILDGLAVAAITVGRRLAGRGSGEHQQLGLLFLTVMIIKALLTALHWQCNIPLGKL